MTLTLCALVAFFVGILIGRAGNGSGDLRPYRVQLEVNHGVLFGLVHATSPFAAVTTFRLQVQEREPQALLGKGYAECVTDEADTYGEPL